jgi:hypothetical protein
MSTTELGAETSTERSLEDDLTRAFDASENSSGADSGTTAEATAHPSGVSGEPNASLEAPKHWSEGDKTLFAGLPPAAQKRWMERETEQQRGVDAKFQEIAGFRREREQWDEMFKPYARDLELQGVSSTQFLSRLLAGHKYLLDSPKEAFLWLANQYGVDPKALFESRESNPHLDKLNQGFQSLEQKVNGFMTAQQKAEQAAAVSRVEAFATAKDDKGQLAHPYFDEVQEDVLAILKAQPQGQKDLEVAYKKAVRMNDGVWQKSQAAAEAATKASADAKRKADIDKAKRAGVTSETTTTVNGSAKPKSLQDALEEKFAGWGN